MLNIKFFYIVRKFGTLLTFCCFSLLTFSQTHLENNHSVILSLKNFSNTHLIEKVYLHFDKPNHQPGDTIYFKAYVTYSERHHLSQLSGVLHADLINPGNKIIQSVKLQLIHGLACGDFALPDSLPGGRYRLRAYTNWMRNEGDAAFFERELYLGTPEKSKIAESAQANIKAEIQFFPEGGTLINGLRSKIAFKAIDGNGIGVGASGIVSDINDVEVCRFSSTHLGMGYFYLRPQPGQNYTAKVTYANGTHAQVRLPTAETAGIVLSVNNDSLPKATVKIEAGKDFFERNKGKVYTVLIYSGGVATTIDTKLDSNIIAFDIVKRRLHTGVATVTLFSPENEPLCERLFFVQNYDQLTIGIKSDKETYATRGKVNINLDVKNRADSASMGHFSVSVVDESKIIADTIKEENILTNLLLTSDLKGEIEQPNYYFENTGDEARQNLDLVMLTHGYRRFEWKQVLTNKNAPPAYQPEKGLEIAGRATMVSGRPLVKGAVSLIAPYIGGTVLSAETDDKGNFRFNNLVFMDTTKFILQAVKSKGNNSILLTYKADMPAPVATRQYQKAENIDTGYKAGQYFNKQKKLPVARGAITGKILKQVNIHGHKDVPPVITDRYGKPDYTIQGKDIIFGGLLTDRLEDKIPGVDFPKSGIGNDAIAMKRVNIRIHPVPMRIIVDGFEMPTNFSINSISAALVEKIEVMTNATVHDLDTDGAVLITLKHGWSAGEIPSKGILPITAIGFYKAREFYSPQYDNPNTNQKMADLRSTIYWSPNIITDKDGKASFSYFNADSKGTYRMVIEGIDADGNLGRQVFRYKVE